MTGITWANEMNFSMKHAPEAGLIARLVDLCHHCATATPLPIQSTYAAYNSRVTRKHRNLPREYTDTFRNTSFIIPYSLCKFAIPNSIAGSIIPVQELVIITNIRYSYFHQLI